MPAKAGIQSSRCRCKLPYMLLMAMGRKDDPKIFDIVMNAFVEQQKIDKKSEEYARQTFKGEKKEEKKEDITPSPSSSSQTIFDKKNENKKPESQSQPESPKKKF